MVYLKSMSKREKKIQKALGTLPVHPCDNCKRLIPKNELQYMIQNNKLISLCKLCRRLYV